MHCARGIRVRVPRGHASRPHLTENQGHRLLWRPTHLPLPGETGHVLFSDQQAWGTEAAPFLPFLGDVFELSLVSRVKHACWRMTRGDPSLSRYNQIFI